MPASKKRQTSIAETFAFASIKRAKYVSDASCRIDSTIILTLQGTTTTRPAIIDPTRSEDQENGYEGDELDDADFLALEGDQEPAVNEYETNGIELHSPEEDQGLVPNEDEIEKGANFHL